MAKKRVPQSVTVNVADAREHQKFFSLNGTYLIDPDVSATDLINDIPCLLEASEGGIQTVIDGLSDEGSQMAANLKDAVRLLFGVLYQIEMVSNMVNAIPLREAQS